MKNRSDEHTKSEPIGWNGKTLKEMLLESENVFKETGRCYGCEELSLRDKDPILYERIFTQLRGGMVRARETALNISASPIVREVGELCFALYTPEGDSVTLSTGIIVHVHTMSDAIKWAIRHDYEENPGIVEGDIFINNDPFVGDVHNGDVANFVPIFYGEKLIGWAGGVTHVLDIGAKTPGGTPVGPINRYESGILFTFRKMGHDDIIDRDHQIQSEMAVRTPMYWNLDEKTRVAGCHMIRDAVMDVIDKIGIDTYKSFIRECIEEGRRSFKNRVKEMLVPGIYEAPSFMDYPYKEDLNMPIEARVDTLMHAPCELEIGGDGSLGLSYDGANAWGKHSFNTSPSGMQGALWVLLTQTLICNDKINDGAYLATNSYFPPGSIFNPDNINACTTEAWIPLVAAFNGVSTSLARGFYMRGFIEEVVAGFGGTWDFMVGGGTDHFGRPSAMGNFEISSVGGGAGAVKDGLDYAAAMWNPEGDMGNMEGWEMLEPFLYLGRGVKASSAGMGRHRGGSGFESMRMLSKTNDYVVMNMGDGHALAFAGMFGGYPAAGGYRHNVHNTNYKEFTTGKKLYPELDYSTEEDSLLRKRVTGDFVFDMNCNFVAQPYREGDFHSSFLRGAPGLGDPLERKPDAVIDDLNGGYLVDRFAPAIYGVVADKQNGKWRLDQDSTLKRREEIRKERRQKSVPTREWMDKERERIEEKKFISPVRDMYASSFSLSPKFSKKFRAFWGLSEDFEF